jgi:hypothetical protein
METEEAQYEQLKAFLHQILMADFSKFEILFTKASNHAYLSA